MVNIKQNTNEKIEPIKPKDIHISVSNKTIQIINQLISDSWDGKEAKVVLNVLKEKIKKEAPKDVDRLNNVISIYENFGWEIEVSLFLGIWKFTIKKPWYKKILNLYI